MAEVPQPDYVRYYYGVDADAAPRDSHVLRIARLALLTHLFSDGEVQRLFAKTEAIVDEAWRISERVDRLAAVWGFTGRRELLARCLEADFDPSDLSPSVLVMTGELQEAYERFMVRYRNSVPACRNAVERLVTKTWRLPWSWLVTDVCRMFRATVDGIVLGQPWNVADLDVVTQAPNGSPRRGAYVRVEQIKRDVRWLYLNKIHAPSKSKRSLALEAGVEWQTVDAGIVRARRVFSEVPTGAVLAELFDGTLFVLSGPRAELGGDA